MAAIALALLFPVVESGAEALLWPINSPKSVSSSFGEYRPGRFHLGIDFKSGGVTGKDVYALGDGYVFQVRTSPFGYGKCMYIKLDSGEMVVYGHLSGFLPEIEERLFRFRIRKESYDVAWFPNPHEIRVKRGDVVAFSGDTGSGPAHLHIEIRDGANNPMNPLSFGFDVRDAIPPVIAETVIMPIEGASTIDGLPDSRWIGDVSPAEAPLLNGKFGIAADIFDRTSIARNIIAAYRVVVELDSTVVFTKTYDKIPYSTDLYGAFDYMPGSRFDGRGIVTALYRQDGNGLPIYSGTGVIDTAAFAPNSTHTVTIRAFDYAGNTAVKSFPVRFGHAPILTKCLCDEAGTLQIEGRGFDAPIDRIEIRNAATPAADAERTIEVGKDICSVTVEFGDPDGLPKNIVLVDANGLTSRPASITWTSRRGNGSPDASIAIEPEFRHDVLIVNAESDRDLGSLPTVRMVSVGGVIEETGMIPAGENRWVTALSYPGTGSQKVKIAVDARDSAGNQFVAEDSLSFMYTDPSVDYTLCSDDSLFVVTIPSGSLYRHAAVRIDTVGISGRNGLFPVAGGYRVHAGDYPVKGAFRISLDCGKVPPEKAALYAGSGSNWRFVSAARNGSVFTGICYPESALAVLIDTLPPYVSPSSPRPNATIGDRNPLINVRLEDSGSGIAGSDSIVMTIDGIPIYGEYDYQAKKVSYRLRNPLESGRHTVTVAVTDRVGNTRTKEWRFTVK